MKRAGDYNQSPRHGKIIKPSPQQEKQAYDRMGFIQGGAFIRSSKTQAAMMENIRKNAGEKKGVDTVISSPSLTNTTGTNQDIFLINAVETGNGSWNRVGRQMYNKSIRIKVNFAIGVEAEAVTGNIILPTIRMVVVWDKQPSSGTLPLWSDIFGKTIQGGTESSVWSDNPKYDNMGRFQLLRDSHINLYDKVGIMPASGANNFLSLTVLTDEYVKLGNRQTVFSGQSVPMTIADISTGALYVGFRSSVAPAVGQTTIQIVNTSSCRLRYTD